MIVFRRILAVLIGLLLVAAFGASMLSARVADAAFDPSFLKPSCAGPTSTTTCMTRCCPQRSSTS